MFYSYKKTVQIDSIIEDLEKIISSNELNSSIISDNLDLKKFEDSTKHETFLADYKKIHSCLLEYDECSVSDFNKVHNLLFNIEDDQPHYRDHEMYYISKRGYKFSQEHFCKAYDIEAGIDQIFQYIKNETNHSIIKSLVVQFNIMKIHPYSDGNGRVASLWQQLILYREFPQLNALNMYNLQNSNRDKYFISLSQSERTKSVNPFIIYMTSALASYLKSITHNSN